MEFQNFYLPFGGQLDGENRWVILAKQIPWQRIEQEYSALFSQDEGCPAKAARVGFGALIIKERLGRPKKITEMNAADLKKEKQIHYQDELDRNAIEGKFGQGKRRFTLGLIMAKLAQTSEAVISISFIVMNLEKILSVLFCFLAYHYQTYCQTQHDNAPDARNRFLPLQIAA
jgi:hypothetical protein